MSALAALRQGWREPAAMAAVTVGVAVLLALDELTVADARTLAGGIVAYLLGAALPWRVSAPAVGVLLAGLLAADGLQEPVPAVLVTAGPWLVASILRERRRLTAALAERAAELEQERERHAELAARQERARIARELHDIVAHHLAVIAVQAGAGRLGAAAGTSTPGRFGDIGRSAERALDELDVLVGVLQAEVRTADELRGRLAEAVEGARSAGLRVHADVPACDVADAVAETAYRVVQEGLTNALKHAPGAEVEVHVALATDTLRIHVRDDGRRAAGSLAGSGSGLGLPGLRRARRGPRRVVRGRPGGRRLGAARRAAGPAGVAVGPMGRRRPRPAPASARRPGWARAPRRAPCGPGGTAGPGGRCRRAPSRRCSRARC